MQKFKLYFMEILIPLLVGTVAGLIITKFMDYANLVKPPLSPPGILFPIVWTILYILMGISHGILKNNNLVSRDINSIYYFQLFVNALWSIIFFVLKWRFIAFIWILLLVILVFIMVVRFTKKNKIAVLLQIPYLLWVLFASYLNLGIYLLNQK